MHQKTVAIVGASADRAKYGNRSVRAHVRQGWTVYPVNPRGGEVEGLKVWRSLEEIPVPLDRVSLYVPPPVGLKLLPVLAKLRPAELFVNPGAESEELVTRAQELGLEPILACSILDVGETPEELGA
ncbi:MAG: CoA-binding protein [Phycisphaerae bacterium]|jgi:predicted CoA-binding protein